MLRLLARLAAASIAAAALAAPASAQYPNRPITLVVPWGAGGGTDATARILASIMEKELKQPVSVVNRTGGNGVVGHSAIAEATADGYTIGLITVEIGMMHWQGLTKLTGASYTPLGLLQDVKMMGKVGANEGDIEAPIASPKAWFRAPK